MRFSASSVRVTPAAAIGVPPRVGREFVPSAVRVRIFPWRQGGPRGMNRDLSEEQLVARQRLLVEVNSNIGADAHDLPAAERTAGGWDFLCECGDAGCAEMVHLTLAGYDRLRAGGRFVLAENHTVQRAELARDWARRLARDAAALRAQAQHQQKRALKNRDRFG